MNENPQEEQSLFRRYWWVLLILLFVIALCCGVLGGAFGRDLVDRIVKPPLPTEEVTEIPDDSGAAPAIDIPTDSPTATAIEIETETLTPTPTETPTPTVTATATRSGPVVTCKCKGTDYVCSNGVTTKNSPRCPTPVAPTATTAPAACTAGWKPASGCTCCGNDLYCADGSVGIFNFACACHCEGTTGVCNDGGTIKNAPQCGGKP